MIAIYFWRKLRIAGPRLSHKCKIEVLMLLRALIIIRYFIRWFSKVTVLCLISIKDNYARCLFSIEMLILKLERYCS